MQLDPTRKGKDKKEEKRKKEKEKEEKKEEIERFCLLSFISFKLQVCFQKGKGVKLEKSAPLSYIPTGHSERDCLITASSIASELKKFNINKDL